MRTKFLTIVGAALIVLGVAKINGATPLPIQQQAPATLETRLTIEGIVEAAPVLLWPGATAFDQLEAFANERTIALTVKEYAGLGKLVEQIGERRNGLNNQYWHYLINGVLADKGADALILNVEDQITWQYSALEY